MIGGILERQAIEFDSEVADATDTATDQDAAARTSEEGPPIGFETGPESGAETARPETREPVGDAWPAAEAPLEEVTPDDESAVAGCGLPLKIDVVIVGQREEVFGYFYQDTAHVALRLPDGAGTLHHEAVHALREFGLFTAAEWRALERRTVQDWRSKFDIDQIYADFGDELRNEEAVDSAFDAFMQDDLSPYPKVFHTIGERERR